MKTLQIVALFCAVLLTNAVADNRYSMKSGVIEYSITGGGNYMGMQTTTDGKKTLVFKDWGNVELLESTENTKIANQKPEKQHGMMKFENGKIYGVDFDEKVIYVFDATNNFLMNDNKAYPMFQKDILEKNKAKRLKDEKVLGYSCEVWQMKDSKIWIHKGIALKVVSNSHGVSYKEEATKVEFNKPITKEQLALPAYPIKDIEESVNEVMDSLSDEEKNQLKELMQGLPISLEDF